MDNDKLNRNIEEIIDRHVAASSEMNAVDLNKLRQIEREIDCYKPMLRSYRDKYENIETEICDVRQLQRKARFVLDNVRSEEEDLHASFRNLRLNYEACVERSSGYEDPNETIHAKINELTTMRRKLMEELTQFRKKADNHGQKLARVKAMITEQEKRNATQLQKLKEISENIIIPISPNISKRIDTVLRHQEINEGDDVIDNTMQ
ncbi:uncharacterized protein LOC105837656 isoform X1 [Monomorium pharaonis]|uniref:uncharacterized protein LOC105837656 isoform X1 n=2 Tax=Monomorium pharaonis TaxID=307658 RepID=UPI00063F2461|nr:uncharacterized protein LOC105837656 isoform X1 [Monomorium pharaonis]